MSHPWKSRAFLFPTVIEGDLELCRGAPVICRKEYCRAVSIVVGVVVIVTVVILLIIVDRSPFAVAKVDEVVPLMIPPQRLWSLISTVVC